jgi:DNA repair protein RecO
MRKSLSPPGTVTEGIILSAIPFEETSYILNLFSKEWGRIKLVTKQPHRKHIQSYSSLLAIEALVIPSEKELWKCRDCHSINSYPRLRSRLESLYQGATISDLLAKILPLHLSLPAIYSLFSSFLENMPSFAHPHVAATAFLAQFCIHEGFFPAEKTANVHFSAQELDSYIYLATSDLETIRSECTDKALLSKLIEYILG